MRSSLKKNAENRWSTGIHKGHSADGDERCIPRIEGNDYVKRLGEGTVGSECLKDSCPVEKQCIKQTKNNLCKKKAWCSIKDTTHQHFSSI